MTKIYKSYFKGIESIVLESNLLLVTVIPFGGRIVSIKSKDKKREYLVQQTSKDYLNGIYDGHYIDYEPCGYDDMFPTIDECQYRHYPWESIKIPDHGELWGLPWDYTICNDNLDLSINGIRLPYHFSKSISIISENILRIVYSIRNLSNFDFDFIWTAHPMFIAEEDLEIQVPDECSEAVNVLDFSKTFSKQGEEFNWPDYKDREGIIHRFNKFQSLKKGDCEKYYFKNKLKKGWLKLFYPSDKSCINIIFPEEKIPYLGILMDKNYFFKDKISYIIPEPCTSPFDRLDLSSLSNQNSVLYKKSVYDWNLDIVFT